MALGVAAAIFATFVWAMNFVVPFVVGKYTIFDLALLRFSVSALVGIGILTIRRNQTLRLSAGDWITASCLAFLGYVGYFLAVTGAAIYAGPIIAPAFLGLVPVIVAIAGNFSERAVPWRRLSVPLLVISFGLLLVNRDVFRYANIEETRSLALGIPLAMAAVIFWTLFALLNQSALAGRPMADSMIWTALMMVSGGLQMILFLPLGAAFGLFGLAKQGAGWDTAHAVYISGAMLALFSSVVGAWAWTIAARRLPVALSAQLVVLETVFGAVFGLAVRREWPDVIETFGILSLIFGVVFAIRIFYSRSSAEESASAQAPFRA
jgi:drug/metabolite transporter (DMT)-like permease